MAKKEWKLIRKHRYHAPIGLMQVDTYRKPDGEIIGITRDLWRFDKYEGLESNLGCPKDMKWSDRAGRCVKRKRLTLR